MKLIVIFLITWMLRITESAAQGIQDSIMPKLVELGLPSDAELKYKSNFSGVRFFDNRFDTSNIGYSLQMVKYPKIQKNYACLSFEKVQFKRNLAETLNNYYNSKTENISNSNLDSLWIVIKELRISSVSAGSDGEEPQFAKVHLLLAKKHNSQIYSLQQYDTSIRCKGNSYKVSYSDCLKKIIQLAIVKAGKFSFHESMDSLSEDVFFKKYMVSDTYEIPIHNVLKRGAYENISQMINNSPRYLNIRYPYADTVNYDILISDDSGHRVSDKLIWGYCDGNTIYVHAEPTRENYYPLIRFENSFIISLVPANIRANENAAKLGNGVALVFGVLSGGKGSGSLASGIDPPIILEIIRKRRFQLAGTCINMESGKIDY